MKFLSKVVQPFIKCMHCVLSVGPMPSHIGFIMDGNRRYGTKNKLKQVAGHEAGYFALLSMVTYCYELGIKYVTAYAFSIMDLMTEKFELLCRKDSFFNGYGIRVHVSGNLQLLPQHSRDTTVNNSGLLLTICMAYTSTDEIIHAFEKCCQEKWVENDGGIISLADIEKRMYVYEDCT
ncbi:hypothetical protein PVK06_006899 [Gossypium arboreum]|uniref:Alkyl transferase n=1 Tax=Gossypium arboreum TaxID=29729 RepID=A0ABR0QGN1_GOSAR|nr:hypothetical protein PVK06_006899 [Gossypium arboreum]